MTGRPRPLVGLAAALLALTCACSADEPGSDTDRSADQSTLPSATTSTAPSPATTAPVTEFRSRPGLVVARIRTGSGTGPSGVALGHGSVWVTTHRSGELLRIDPDTHRIVKRIRIPDAEGFVEAAPLITPDSVVLCVGGETGDRVVSVDPETNRMRPRRMPCLSLGHGELGTWVMTYDRVTRIDPVSLRTLRVLRPEGLPTSLTGDLVQLDGSLWVSTGGGAGALYRLDPRNGDVQGQWRFGNGNFTLAQLGKHVYFTNPTSHEVSVIDARTDTMTRKEVVPGSDEGDPILCAGYGELWASTLNGGLARLDPRTLEVIASAQLGTQDYVGEIAVGKGRIWYPTYGGDEVLEVRSGF